MEFLSAWVFGLSGGRGRFVACLSRRSDWSTPMGTECLLSRMRALVHVVFIGGPDCWCGLRVCVVLLCVARGLLHCIALYCGTLVLQSYWCMAFHWCCCFPFGYFLACMLVFSCFAEHLCFLSFACVFFGKFLPAIVACFCILGSPLTGWSHPSSPCPGPSLDCFCWGRRGSAAV